MKVNKNQYHLSLKESSVEKLHRLRQRTQNIQIRLGIADSINHVTQVSDNALKKLENHGQMQRPSLSTIDWKEKLKKIRQRTQKLKEEITQTHQSCDIALKIADHDLKQADDVIQNVAHIKNQQENLDQQMLSVQQDVEDISTRTIVLSKRNRDLSQNIESIRQALSESRENVNSLQSDVESIASDFSQQEKTIDCDEMNKRVQVIESNQKEMEEIHGQTIYVEFIKRVVIENQLSKSVQEIYTNIPSFTFTWEGGVKDKITTAFSEFAQSQAVMMFKHTAKSLCNIVWTFIKENISPIAWIAMGIFGTCFTVLSLRYFPIETLLIGGGLCIVTRVVVMPIIDFVNS